MFPSFSSVPRSKASSSPWHTRKWPPWILRTAIKWRKQPLNCKKQKKQKKPKKPPKTAIKWRKQPLNCKKKKNPKIWLNETYVEGKRPKECESEALHCKAVQSCGGQIGSEGLSCTPVWTWLLQGGVTWQGFSQLAEAQHLVLISPDFEQISKPTTDSPMPDDPCSWLSAFEDQWDTHPFPPVQETHLPEALLAISSASSSLSCSACRRARSDEASSWVSSDCHVSSGC